MDEAVDLCVRGGDLAIQRGLLVRVFRLRALPVLIHHLLNQCDDASRLRFGNILGERKLSQVFDDNLWKNLPGTFNCEIS